MVSTRRSRDWYYDYAGPPLTKLVVECRDLTTNKAWKKVFEVHRPIGISYERDQMVRKVAQISPEAQLASSSKGIAVFFSRREMIVASYEDASPAQAESGFGASRVGGHEIPI